MAEDVDVIVESVEENAVGADARIDRNALEQLQRLRVEHRDLRAAAREAVPRLRIDRDTIALRVGRGRDLADRRQLVEIEYGDARGDRRTLGCGVGLWRGTDSAARDVEPASDRIGKDVIPAAFTA